jgi:hypothetical protein
MESDKKSVPRILQQHASREGDDAARQQPDGASQTRPEADAGGKPQQQMGEGSYEATRDYQKKIGEYMDKADVESDAEAAKPRSEQEAREMNDAEREGRSHGKGER